ncbi:MAG: hypothetical protein NVSMB44_39510 [Ktedonobacteraceae bacterium]
MLKRQVNDAIGSSGTTVKAVEVVEVTVAHLGPGFFESRSTMIRTCQPNNLMTAANKLANDSGTDKACCSCYKHTHKKIPLLLLRPPRHKCAGVPVTHPSFPVAPEGTTSS